MWQFDMAIMSTGEIYHPEESTPTDKLVINSIAAKCLHTSYINADNGDQADESRYSKLPLSREGKFL